MGGRKDEGRIVLIAHRKERGRVEKMEREIGVRKREGKSEIGRASCRERV